MAWWFAILLWIVTPLLGVPAFSRLRSGTEAGDN